jgi:hypothetical protein
LKDPGGITALAENLLACEVFANTVLLLARWTNESDHAGFLHFVGLVV